MGRNLVGRISTATRGRVPPAAVFAALATLLSTPLAAQSAAPSGPAEAAAANADGAARAAAAPVPVRTDAATQAVVFLVRHAETAGDHPRDPSLSAAGEARARRLAQVLADAGLDRIYSTPFRRTEGTAAPVAEAVGLEVHGYDPREEASMDDLLGRIRGEGGRILVVGHSNTTPALVRTLGADPVSPIAEDEHDRLYVVHLAEDGTATATLLRYGG